MCTASVAPGAPARQVRSMRSAPSTLPGITLGGKGRALVLRRPCHPPAPLWRCTKGRRQLQAGAADACRGVHAAAAAARLPSARCRPWFLFYECRPRAHLLRGKQRQAARRRAHQRAAGGQADGARRTAQVWHHGCAAALPWGVCLSYCQPAQLHAVPCSPFRQAAPHSPTHRSTHLPMPSPPPCPPPPAVKKKESKLYGAHFKDVDHSQKATKMTFDSDDE